MSKIPTPKQVRFHYKKIASLHDRLAAAMNDAHNAGVIDYPEGTYGENAPCKTHWETLERLERSTEKQLAVAMRWEILNGK